jgi:hypothetical protein
MSERSAAGKAVTILVLVVVGLILAERVTLWARLANEPDEPIPTSSFCTSFWRQIDGSVAEVRRGIADHPRKGDLDVGGYEAIAGVWWSEGIIDGGPPELRGPARVVAHGFQTALATHDVAPLDAPGFRAAVRRLARDGTPGCAHHFPGLGREDPASSGS